MSGEEFQARGRPVKSQVVASIIFAQETNPAAASEADQVSAGLKGCA
jgi:hypothetical protein